MEKGATNPGDSPQQHAHDLHGVGTHFENPTHVNHGHSLGTHDYAGQAVQDPGFVFSANDVNYGLNPFNAIAARGVAYSDNTYGGLGVGVNNVEAGFSPYDNAAAPSFTSHAVQHATLTPYVNNINGGVYAPGNLGHNDTINNVEAGFSPYDNHAAPGFTSGAAQDATATPYANNINDGIYAPSNLGHNGTNYLGHTLGNVTVPDIAYNQSANAALPLHYNDGAYPTGNVSASFYPSNNATATGMADGSDNHATYDAGLGAQSSGTTPTVSSTLSPGTPGSVAGPNGRRRWACTGCVKTFSRQSDMKRHARKHSDVLQYQCNVTGCTYPGSDRQDKLDQHKRNRH